MLARIPPQIVERRNLQVLVLSKPGVLGGVQRLVVLDADAAEALVVELDEIVALAGAGAEERVAQVDAVEDDRLAVIVLPVVRGRLKPGELAEGRPPVHVGPRVHIDRAGFDVPRPPGDGWHLEAAFEGVLPRKGV